MSGLVSRLVARCAAAPVALVAAALVLGAVLADVHTLWVARMYDPSTGQPTGEEPAQWATRLTVLQYYAIIPLGLIALWARRRTAQGRLGRIAAVLLAAALLGHLVITGAACVWGGLLGRGDLGTVMTALEVTVLGLYLGVLLEGVALLRDRELPRAVGALVLLGLVVSFLAPFALTVAWALLAAVLLRTAALRPSVVSPSDRLAPTSDSGTVAEAR